VTSGMWYAWCTDASCQTGFSKESYLDKSTHLGSPMSTYPPNFVKTPWSGQRYAPKTKFEMDPLAAEFYFRFQFWQVSSFGDLPVYDPTKFQEYRSMCGWVICDSNFSIPTFKPTLPTTQRHSAVMQAIYRLRKLNFSANITENLHREHI